MPWPPPEADSAEVLGQAPATLNPAISKKLLRWFDKERRELPWRAPPGTLPDAYRVWISEVMLQQTRVEVVRDYYERWMRALPNLQALADASEEQVLGLWQGLGYYSRARRLLCGARFVRDHYGGMLPSTAEALLEVPGIGPYSAGAISSIAYDNPDPVVDGNVIRVLSRLFELDGDPAKSPLKRQLWELAGQLVPKRRAGDFNQALMELGALICTPRRPQCATCPLRGECKALRTGRTLELPALKKKAPPTPLHMIALIARRRGRVLVQQQAGDARWWAGLWTFPFFEADLDANPLDAVHRQKESEELCWLGGSGRAAEALAPLTHTITRFRIQISPLVLEVPPGLRAPKRAGRFVSLAELDGLPMPAPHRRLHRLVASG